MEHRTCLRDRQVEAPGIADVGHNRGDPIGMAAFQPSEVPGDAGPDQGVVDDDVLPVPSQSISEVGTNEPGTAGDEYGTVRHATRPRASSSRRASATRSTACCWATQPASSAKPSEKSR